MRVRAGKLEYAACHDKWWAMFNALQNASITDVYQIEAMASGPLGWTDEKNRHNLTANFRVVRKRPT